MVRTMTLALIAAALSLAAAPKAQAQAEATVAWMEIDGPLAERPGPFDWLMGEKATTLGDLVGSLEEIAADDRIDGVALRLREPAWNMAQIEEVGAALREVREAGKRVTAFSDTYFGPQLMIASYADDVLMQSGGAVMLTGVYMEELFLADTLSMLGVKADFVQIGDYKGAEEMFANSEPSEAWDENISQLLDSLYETKRETLKKNLGLSDEGLDEAMERGWLAGGEEAARMGLIDEELDRLDLTAWLEKAHGEGVRFEMDYDPSSSKKMKLDTANPFAMLQMLMRTPENSPTRDTIAVLHVNGQIVDGESTPAGPFGASTVGSITIREALKKLEDNGLIKGVVVRVDSPGGSAIASEAMWLGIRRVAEKKPVWVSVGAMAASGGYYVAVAGDRIFVDPSSIVGSIGVVGGKFAMEGLYGTMRIGVKARSRGPNADMMSTVDTWSEPQRRLVRDRMTEVYDQFVGRVKQGREGIDIARTAEGRLFTGEKAIGLKMADEVGGLDDAVETLASEAGVAEGYDVMHYPGPQSFEDFLDQLTGGLPFASAGGERGGLAQAAAVETLKEVFGPRAWAQVRDALAALMQLREESVLLVSPRTLIFR